MLGFLDMRDSGNPVKGRLDAWEAGRFIALVKDFEEAAQEDGWGTHDQEFILETTKQKYDAMTRSEKLRAVVRMVTDRDPGGLFQPSDK